jgi:hypothetical protein
VNLIALPTRLARAILDYASHDDDLYHLTDDERRELRSGLAEMRRGDIASDDEVAETYIAVSAPRTPAATTATRDRNPNGRRRRLPVRAAPSRGQLAAR